MESITKERLDNLVEMYKLGVQIWPKDEHFQTDCAYYEGAIKRACEKLGIEIPYTYLEITFGLHKAFNRGYEHFWES